jgi:hypothetical protein
MFSMRLYRKAAGRANPILDAFVRSWLRREIPSPFKTTLACGRTTFRAAFPAISRKIKG